MRSTFSLGALASAGIVGSASAALAPVSGITASANGWDTRTEGWGCSPGGCIASNSVDGSLDYDSRWSCNPQVSDVAACELTLELAEPADIKEVRIALWKGTRRTRALNILVDGTLASSIESSGDTESYETYELAATQASTIVVQAAGTEDNGWLSILEIEFMVETTVETSAPTPAPTDPNYIGCFADTIADRVMLAVTASDEMTTELCATTCSDAGYPFYALQQGNECWCADCDLTENDTNTDYDRHGEGSCNVACAGDASSTCGGDMAFSLYQTSTCEVTPAPTPSIPPSDCPSTSVQSSLELSLSWEEDTDLDFWVMEPGGKEVYYGQRLGDVGMMSNDKLDGPGSETYTLLNGLDVASDNVLGDYEVWVTNGQEGTEWLITARAGGELISAIGGVVRYDSDSTSASERYTFTVADYAESTCDIDLYGNCPQGAYSEDGTPPCLACPVGFTSNEGSSSCVLSALQNVDLPEDVAEAVVADAVGGFAGPGYLNGDFWQTFLIAEEDDSTLELSGSFERYDETALPDSTAVFIYIVSDGVDDFTRGQGVITPSGDEPYIVDFTATVTDVPVGVSRVILSFVVLDPAEALDEQGSDTIFDISVVNNVCSNPLVITLEWDTDNSDFDLGITEPSGDFVGFGDTGTYGFHSGDITDGFGPEIYTAVGSNPDAVGEYMVEAQFLYAPVNTQWTITAEVNGVIAWVETGTYVSRDFSFSYDDDSSDNYAVFTVNLDSVEDVC